MLGTAILQVDNKLVLVTANEVQYERQETKADGTLGKSRKATMTVVHSYCPFCGIKK